MRKLVSYTVSFAHRVALAWTTYMEGSVSEPVSRRYPQPALIGLAAHNL